MGREFDESKRNNVLFRTALKGYNKQDVNDFIESLIRSNEKNSEHYSSHIRSIEEDRTENAKKILELSNRNEVLSGIVQAEAEARLEIEKTCEQLKEQLEKYKAQLSEDKTRLDELDLAVKSKDKKIAELEKSVEQLKIKTSVTNDDRKKNLYARLRGTQNFSGNN